MKLFGSKNNSPEKPDGPSIRLPEKFRRPGYYGIAGILFVVMLVMVFVLNIVMPDVKYSEQENRVLTAMPRLTPSSYFSGRFESKLNDYANDQFMFRNFFIKTKSAADLTMGQIKSNGIYKGKNGYLLEDIEAPNGKELDSDLAALKKFKKKYSGKKMYFMMVPNAANILRENIPLTVTVADQDKIMDDFFESIRKIGYKPVDVRDALRKEKKKHQIYYRTDHHWTTDGAYAAYKSAAKTLGLKSDIKYKAYTVKNDFEGTLYSKSGFTNGRDDAIRIYIPDDKKYRNSVFYYTDTKKKTTDFYELDNLIKKDAYTVFGGDNHSVFKMSTPTKSRKNLLIIKDSYANCFIPFLSQDYRTVTVVDPRYYYDNIATIINANDINEVLFIYNANTFFQDTYMRMVLTNK